MGQRQSAASPAITSIQTNTRIHKLSLGLACAYLLETKTGLVLVDSGIPRQEKRILHLMHSLGRQDLKLIVITHAHLDHYGSASAIHHLTDAPIAIHHADAGAMQRGETHLGIVRGRGKIVQALFSALNGLLKPPPTSAHLFLDDNFDLASYGLDAVVVHTPGHTPGSICLLVEGCHAFVGDLVSTTGKPHTQRFYAADWTQIPRSLQRLRILKPTWIYPGHGHEPLDGQSFQTLTAQM